MAEKMEFIKMFKRMVKNLKYTQNFVCFAVGKILLSPFKVLDNGLDKVFDNNLISKAASLSSLDQAFHDLYNSKIKKQKDHNDLFWHYARNWQTRRLTLRQELQDGTYKLGEITNYTIPTGIENATTEVSAWDDESLIVLKVLKNVLEAYLKSKMDLTAASHLKDHGGLKASVNKAHKLSQDKKKGFSFLGYKILGETLRISTTSLRRLRANINRLYEQQASNARLGRYLEKWLRWAKGGVNNLINPINFNINPNPSTRMQVRVSNDMCHVFW